MQSNSKEYIDFQETISVVEPHLIRAGDVASNIKDRETELDQALLRASETQAAANIRKAG